MKTQSEIIDEELTKAIKVLGVNLFMRTMKEWGYKAVNLKRTKEILIKKFNETK